MQLFAVNFISLQHHSTCFGCFPHPPSGVHKTVSTAAGTGHIIVAATFLQRGQDQTLLLWKNGCILLVYYNIDYDARNHKHKKRVMLSVFEHPIGQFCLGKKVTEKRAFMPCVEEIGPI